MSLQKNLWLAACCKRLQHARLDSLALGIQFEQKSRILVYDRHCAYKLLLAAGTRRCLGVARFAAAAPAKSCVFNLAILDNMAAVNQPPPSNEKLSLYVNSNTYGKFLVAVHANATVEDLRGESRQGAPPLD